MTLVDPSSLIQARRKVTGISAILLPFLESGEIDWQSFDQHLLRTAQAGLTAAVNMDTGYVNLLDTSTQGEILGRTRSVLGGKRFVAGAFISDRDGDPFSRDEYLRRMQTIQDHGGMPIVFQSYGLTRQPGPEIVSSYAELAKDCDQFLGFELTMELAPFGAIYDIETFAGLMSITQCVGIKHSSFRREPEWERLQLRNTRRPDFVVFTGNDFAIDMIMYGSDYLLGLSTFAPEMFSLRDRYWAEGDSRFYELNDQLQYLGHFAFRSPSPGYKHSAAQFLKIQGWIQSDRTHPMSVVRPETDIAILREIGERLEALAPAASRHSKPRSLP